MGQTEGLELLAEMKCLEPFLARWILLPVGITTKVNVTILWFEMSHELTGSLKRIFGDGTIRGFLKLRNICRYNGKACYLHQQILQ